jgi:putative tryptophan/tyrosine transport system substrate-binding protein
MNRRAFITLLGGTTVACPIAAFAQQRPRRIAVLMGVAESDPQGQARTAAFRQALQELKWIDGRSVHIDYRWAAADAARAQAYAAELVGLAPDVILGTNTPTVRALHQATKTIPIVFAGLSDPVGDGFVASLAKPGGNITGFSSLDAAIIGKWLQLLKEVAPATERVAVMFNPATATQSIYLPVLEAAAPSFKVTIVTATVGDVGAIETAIAALGREPGVGLVLIPDVFTSLHRRLIYPLVAQRRIPTVYPFRFHPADGGLMSYGSDITDQFRQAASYVDRVLHGAKPADLPVQAPTKFELAINLKTAKALGLDVPQTLLATADEVIE